MRVYKQFSLSPLALSLPCISHRNNLHMLRFAVLWPNLNWKLSSKTHPNTLTYSMYFNSISWVCTHKYVYTHIICFVMVLHSAPLMAGFVSRGFAQSASNCLAGSLIPNGCLYHIQSDGNDECKENSPYCAVISMLSTLLLSYFFFMELWENAKCRCRFLVRRQSSKSHAAHSTTFRKHDPNLSTYNV